MQPFHCDLQRPRCKTQWNYAQRLHKLQLQNRINDDFEGILKGKSSAPKWRKICCQSTTIATFMLRLQYALRLSAAKHNSIPHAAAAARNLDAAIPLRSAETELHSTIATHYCRTHRFNAPVPMHKMSQHMQNTIAQHPQRREKAIWNLQFPTARANQTGIDGKAKDRRTRRTSEPTFLRNGTSVDPKKTQCFDMFRANPNIQITSMM